MQVLHIDSAITGEQSVSRELTKRIVAAWKAGHPNATVQHLDLAAQAPAHLSADALGFRTGQAASTEVQRQENALSEALVSQFLAADVIVIGAPLYNFTIPSQLKAWIDRIAQTGRTFKYTDKGPVGLAGGKTVIVIGAPLYNFTIPSQLKAWIDRIAQTGRTFKYTDKGPVGLAGGKTVIVASTRGGIYSTSEGGQAMEHQESYLKVVFGFFGITDVRFVRAEGVGMGPDAKALAIASADKDIQAHTSVPANQPQIAQVA